MSDIELLVKFCSIYSFEFFNFIFSFKPQDLFWSYFPVLKATCIFLCFPTSDIYLFITSNRVLFEFFSHGAILPIALPSWRILKPFASTKSYLSLPSDVKRSVILYIFPRCNFICSVKPHDLFWSFLPVLKAMCLLFSTASIQLSCISV